MTLFIMWLCCCWLQVVLCQNHIPDQEWMDRTMAHELIHAFDHCRNKIDWNKCEHHACSEVQCHAVSDCSLLAKFWVLSMFQYVGVRVDPRCSVERRL